MRREPAVSGKVICFQCRRSECACRQAVATPTSVRSDLGWAFAWLGAACAAGTALGAVLALLCGN
jgi:hypothetical protein